VPRATQLTSMALHPLVLLDLSAPLLLPRLEALPLVSQRSPSSSQLAEAVAPQLTLASLAPADSEALAHPRVALTTLAQHQPACRVRLTLQPSLKLRSCSSRSQLRLRLQHSITTVSHNLDGVPPANPSHTSEEVGSRRDEFVCFLGWHSLVGLIHTQFEVVTSAHVFSGLL
jgi:hypothetical protein